MCTKNFSHQNFRSTPYIVSQSPQTPSLSQATLNPYSDILKTYPTSPTVLAFSVIHILNIIKLLAILQKCPDVNAREAIINTVMSILNIIPENHYV
ncbi:unnamed protein product [Macrosiphum euphorbiae]|uniref:Uncharacterized protein n=1 Tax=Macrosiphum euphorbiae TaxID=13131 RepID=A0AAV0VLK2_9HEMI|nr:unnamed protein product [Macrosiphum euphorbiae]